MSRGGGGISQSKHIHPPTINNTANRANQSIHGVTTETEIDGGMHTKRGRKTRREWEVEEERGRVVKYHMGA